MSYLFMNYIFLCCLGSLAFIGLAVFDSFSEIRPQVFIEEILHYEMKKDIILFDILAWPLRLIAFTYFMLKYGKLP